MKGVANRDAFLISRRGGRADAPSRLRANPADSPRPEPLQEAGAAAQQALAAALAGAPEAALRPAAAQRAGLRLAAAGPMEAGRQALESRLEPPLRAARPALVGAATAAVGRAQGRAAFPNERARVAGAAAQPGSKSSVRAAGMAAAQELLSAPAQKGLAAG